jgi:hypothetical protein
VWGRYIPESSAPVYGLGKNKTDSWHFCRFYPCELHSWNFRVSFKREISTRYSLSLGNCRSAWRYYWLQSGQPVICKYNPIPPACSCPFNCWRKAHVYIIHSRSKFSNSYRLWDNIPLNPCSCPMRCYVI